MEAPTDERTVWDVLETLRFEYSDEIPEIEIHSSDKSNKYKVRSAWFAGISGIAQMLMAQGFISEPEDQEKVKGFIKKVGSKEFHNRGLTQAKEIEEGNKVLDILLSKKPL